MEKLMSDPEWQKILATSLLTATPTGFVAEPIKVWWQNRIKVRQIRRYILAEVANNLSRLNQVINEILPRRADFRTVMRDLDAISIRAYDEARKDSYLFNRLSESRWLENVYWGFERLGLPLDDPRAEANPGVFARRLITDAIQYIDSHPATRRVVGAVGSDFIKRQIKPTLRMRMSDSWRELQAELNSVQETSHERD
jgi:hypothetical protein